MIIVTHLYPPSAFDMLHIWQDSPAVLSVWLQEFLLLNFQVLLPALPVHPFLLVSVNTHPCAHSAI